ncbi:MAG: hypothetical protein ACREM9_14805, partial [Gemmatimonadales bacterium]
METLYGPSGVSQSNLVHPKERFLYALILLVSLAVYGALVLGALAQPEFAISVGFYGLLFAVIGFVAHGATIGGLRGNGIRVNERQFP